MCFEHIGRHSYRYQPISPMQMISAPKDVLQIGEREMVTGCCFAIRKELFQEIGGFNPNYRIGYWEDAEICMVVREKGYKVLFTPDSMIWHKLGHTESGLHHYQDSNRQYFTNKWVNSGRINDLTNNKRPKPQIKYILLKRSGANGDVLVASSVASALKQKHPEAKISFVTDCPKVLYKNPHIDEISASIEGKEKFYQVFYNLDMAYEYRPYANIVNSFAEAVGVKPELCHPFLHCEPLTSEINKKYVVIHAGKTGWVGRNWNTESFQIIANRLKSNGFTTVSVGHPGENEIKVDIDLRGQTTIPQLSTLIRDSSLFIGIDSFPMHVAQTFNIKSVCFFGSINPIYRIYSPNLKPVIATGLSCLGCHHRKPVPSTCTNICEIGTLDCEKISVETFWNEIIMNNYM
jgi:ADP-heptose:LPS heptosyltransferase